MKVWKPEQSDSGKARYGLTAIFDSATMTPDDKALYQQMWTLYNMVKDTKWPEKKGRHGAQAGMKPTFRDSSTFDLTKNPAYDGKIMISMSSYDRPIGIVDRNRAPISDQAQVYSGAYYKGFITFFPYTTAGGGVGCGISSLMKVMDGEPLAMVSNPEKDFDGVDVSAYQDTSIGQLAALPGMPGLPGMSNATSPPVMDLKALGLG